MTRNIQGTMTRNINTKKRNHDPQHNRTKTTKMWRDTEELCLATSHGGSGGVWFQDIVDVCVGS